MQREEHKVKKYREKVGKAGSSFEPFVCEKEGLGPKAAQLVEHFVRKAQARTSVPYGVMKSYWTQRLTIAMRLTSMICLQECALNNTGHSPVDVAQVVDELGILDTRCVCNNMPVV